MMNDEINNMTDEDIVKMKERIKKYQENPIFNLVEELQKDFDKNLGEGKVSVNTVHGEYNGQPCVSVRLDMASKCDV